MTRQDDYTPQQRAALAAMLITAQGQEMTAAEVAERCGLSVRAAEIMLNNISATIPIMRHGGKWQKFDNE